MVNLRNSSVVKLLCYILIPILVLIFVVSIADVIITTEYGEIDQTKAKTYIQTENFGRNYLTKIVSNINYISQKKEVTDGLLYSRYVEIEENESSNKIYYEEIDDYNYSAYDFVRYIIIDKETNNIYTNIRANDYYKEIETIKNQEIYWNYAENNITTNIETINNDNAKYIISSYYTQEDLDKYEIYSYLDQTALDKSISFSIQQTIYNLFKNNPNAPIYTIPISAILLIAIIIYLVWAIGHTKEKEEIEISGIDKMPYEILSILVFFAIGIIVSIIIASFESQIPQKIAISIFIVGYVGIYALFMLWFTSTIKRLKAKQFWHSFLIYKIYAWVKRIVKKSFSKITDKSDNTKTVILLYIAFLIIQGILLACLGSFIGLLILIVFWVWVLFKLLEYLKQLNTINEALKSIYEGNSDIYLDEKELKGVLKQMSRYVNDIAGGFTNAIEQSLKSERLKTELITNVSHDIKTPLTSIINYVDLLKKEDINNAKIEQYIAVLDKKSQRLKKLIEDLVEASKVSSGNVKLNIENINLKELLKQTIGEFEDKFEKKNLKIDLELPKEEVMVKADSRYMYRVIENLFSNITKYAMDNTRVYIELKNINGIEIEIKNISKDKLNISSEELMQRFVRGDKSRYTEGSGLGLSIAKSLVELQGGVFMIDIDGDLFKVNIKW